MLAVLNRTLVWPFFTRNAGTFGVVFYFAFGFMRPQDHEAFIRATLNAPFLLALVFAGWSLYATRTVAFVRKQLNAPEHLFLQTFRLVPWHWRGLLWGCMFVQLLSPVLGYAGWLGVRAVQMRSVGAGCALVLMLLALLLMGVWAADVRLRRPNPDTTRWMPKRTVSLPYLLFFPAYWLRHEPLSMLLTKAISGGLLLGVCRLYPTDDYDERLLLIGLMLALITHTQLARQLTAFERRYLLLLPNLPLSMGQRLGRYTLLYGLLWLPELLILLRNNPAGVPTSYAGWLWLTGWGWLLLLHALAYSRSIASDCWQTAVFASFILGLLLIMFGLAVGVWLLLGWLGAWLIWRRAAPFQTNL
ncbi:hypothetical protein [Spirosoma montaniterrae]|uniref:Uncharacterized protein n=1 Tax=Spirosoma montaniterrae TaxID=1178516 RepID=A0A1P9WUU8_9BACT|nr:hypothetical protein [Spirosoma montaniterrae]AQG79118.1 hypothetical protein AWR27_07155 [Spirosoma montaniterrae]